MTIKTQEALKSYGFAGLVFYEPEKCWIYRFTQDDDWFIFPQAFNPEHFPSTKSRVDWLVLKGYRISANILFHTCINYLMDSWRYTDSMAARAYEKEEI
jgi:hypothetical protein